MLLLLYLHVSVRLVSRLSFSAIDKIDHLTLDVWLDVREERVL